MFAGLLWSVWIGLAPSAPRRRGRAGRMLLAIVVGLAAVPAVADDRTDAPQALRLVVDGEVLRVATGELEATIGLRDFSVAVDAGKERRLESMQVEVDVGGRTLRITRVDEHQHGPDWVELRGWVDRDQALGYVLRLQFFAQRKAVGAWLSVFDRQVGHPTSDRWDRYWQSRRFGPVAVRLAVPGNGLQEHVVHRTSFDGGRPGIDPEFDAQVGAGLAAWSSRPVEDGSVQLEHAVDGSGGTRLVVRPRREGRFRLALLQEPLFNPYPAANALPILVRHAGGETRVVVDQALRRNPLGEFELGLDSEVVVEAAGGEGDIAVFGALELADGNAVHRVAARRRGGEVLRSRRFALWIPDFWRKHPIEARSEMDALAWRGVLEPALLLGGSGFSLDFALDLEADRKQAPSLERLAGAPVRRTLPEWWSPLDGVVTGSPAYRSLLGKVGEALRGSGDLLDSHGWRDAGDYEIGPSYIAEGEAYRDWAGLQYDLGTGLLLEWLHTGDEALWQRIRIAARSSLDTQVAKFEPYNQKRSGAGLRKGTCSTAQATLCREPIPEYNYHARFLLLYGHLADEAWPREVARMQIDNSAYFARTRTPWLLRSSRPLAWAIRNLVYGARLFPEGTRYNGQREYGYPAMPVGTSYSTLLRELLLQIVPMIESAGHLPEEQPVWQGQVVESLAIAAESGLLDDALAARTAAAARLAAAHFLRESLRREGGRFRMKYSESPEEWVDADAYAGLWLTPLAWAAQPEGPVQLARVEELARWMVGRYNAEDAQFNVANPRGYSAVLSFPVYGFDRLHRSAAAPAR